MRIRDLSIVRYPPIQRFDVSNLLDVVVLAGRNGVGKSRLIEAIIQCFQSPHGQESMRLVIESTNPTELQRWGKQVLDTSDKSDATMLRNYLHSNRSRSNWSGSIIRFESDRSIQQVSPLAFSWDMPDPDVEAVSWNLMFGRLRDRFQDTLHAIFRRVQSQKNQISSRAIEEMKSGKSKLDLSEFKDPMAKFKEAFGQLLAPKVLLDVEPREQQLYYLDGPQRLAFSNLSSGEREAVNIVFDFILRNPSHCIVFFDEPELHLHPELSYRLLQTMRSIGENNQLILCTHSPDIITASLDQSVIFVAPPSDSNANQAVPVREEDESNQALKLLGQSVGVVTLGKRIVLVEGAKTSLDKQTYGQILRAKYPGLVLVPGGGRSTLTSFDIIYKEVLSKAIWGVEFFMLCDRDIVPPARVEALERASNGRLRVLPRYHLENYFLDQWVIANAFETLEESGHWLRDPSRIELKLRESAARAVSYASALATAAQMREEIGNIDVLPKGVHEKGIEDLCELFIAKFNSEHKRVNAALTEGRIITLLNDNYRHYNELLKANDDSWKIEIPGRAVLDRFAGLTGMEVGRIKRLYIDSALKTKPQVFNDIFSIFTDFSS